MTRYTRLFHHVLHLAGTLLPLLLDVVRFLRLCLRPAPVLAAENLLLRKQLACYQERHITPRRVTDAGRFILVWLARWFDWRQALVIVQPQTFTRWHPQSPQANALCERLLGTLRRECLDYLIPLSENHLRGILALPVPLHVHRHQPPDHLRVVTRPMLGGLHHEYRLAKVA